MAIRGQFTCFPITGLSKRQGCVSLSTPEAELVACNFGVRVCGLPCPDLWEILLHRCCPLVVHEDNQAMLRVIETGRNPTMRYLARTYRVSVQWLREVFRREHIRCVYARTDVMAGDIYTKAFCEPDKWTHAQELINIIDAHKLMKALLDHPSKEATLEEPTSSSEEPFASMGDHAGDAVGAMPRTPPTMHETDVHGSFIMA